MSAPPFMPFYVADYLSDTTHLTTEQHGAYLLLLMAMWRAGGCLPNERVKLARYARLSTARWDRLEADIMALFDVGPDTIGSKRLAEEFEKYAQVSTERAKAGARGGKANALKNQQARERLLEEGSTNQKQKEKQKEEDISPDGDTPPLPLAMVDQVRLAFDAYNAAAQQHGLPAARALNEARRKALKARLAEVGLDGWRTAMDRIATDGFLRGDNDRGWIANLDFFLQPSSLLKVIEGAYERTASGRQSPAFVDRGAQQHADRLGNMLAGAQEALDGGGRRKWRL